MSHNTKQNNKQVPLELEHAEWVHDNFTCDGLEPHNRSIRWFLSTCEDLDIRIDRTAERYRHGSGQAFQFNITALSGMEYRVSVTYQPRLARLLSKRFDELDLRSKNQLQTLLHPFQGLLNFDVHWYDARDGTMEHICIERNRRAKTRYWPGDHLVAVTKILADDLRSSLDYSMTTLRSTLITAYPVAWTNFQTPESVKMPDVHRHVGYLKKLQKLRSSEDREGFDEVRAVTLKELFNEEAE
jgi:hypothetical protein